MSDTPRTDAVWKNMHGSGYQMMLLCQKLERELADAKEENLKLSALVVERDYQITLANKGYDYEGAVEDARHYKEMAKDAQEELAKAAARKFRGDPNNNWLMKPSLDWLENAYHGENQARCRMIAGMLRDLWRGDDTLGAMPVAIDAAIKGSAT